MSALHHYWALCLSPEAEDTPLRSLPRGPYLLTCIVRMVEVWEPSGERAVRVHRYVPAGTGAPAALRRFHVAVFSPAHASPQGTSTTSRPATVSYTHLTLPTILRV